MRLTDAQCRQLLLAAQGLLQPPAEPATKADVLKVIRQMGALQIDTIHVVARSPYLVLWSRLGSYEPHWLDELLAEGALFEFWSHAACFLPIEDYALYRYKMLHDMSRWRQWLEEHPDHVEPVRARLRQQGEARSADFARTDGKGGTWWSWKPEKTVLECLFSTGEVMIARRESFQRVYALREHVLPDWDDVGVPCLEDVRAALALKAVRALGVVKARWVPDYFRMPKRGIDGVLERLADEGALIRADVEGWSQGGYIHAKNAALAQAIVDGSLVPGVTTLLSPFDPVVWDRKRAAELFGFDYRIEVYTPGAKRRYGYFSLPILHGDRLVGRLDAKAYRKEDRFEVRSVHLEDGVALTDDLVRGLAQAIHGCAAWHRTPEVAIVRSNPAALAPALESAVSQLRDFAGTRPSPAGASCT